jgi:hypothetical protein
LTEFPKSGIMGIEVDRIQPGGGGRLRFFWGDDQGVS